MSQRNHLIDLSRALSVVVVVTFHCLLYRIVVVDDLPTVLPWAPQPHAAWWTASWFVMIIPLFFIAGGFAHALVIDRMRAEGRGYPYYLAARARRLVGPLLLFTGFATVLSTAGLAVLSGYQRRSGGQFAQLLWFVAIYLVIVGVAPLMVTLHDRFRNLAIGSVDCAGGHGGRLVVRSRRSAAALLEPADGVADVPPARHRLPPWLVPARPGVVPAGGGRRRSVAIPVLVFGLGYPASSIGLGDIPIANVLPPTTITLSGYLLHR